MSALTIGVDIREWRQGTSTGIGRVLTGVISWAADDPAYHFVLIGNQRSEVRVEADNQTLVRVNETSTLYWDHVLLPRVIHRHHVDVLWSPYYKAPLLCPCPSVITIHDLIPFVAPLGAHGKHAPSTVARRTWMKLLAQRASHVVTDSEHSKRDLVSVLGIGADRIAVIPVGLDPAAGRAPRPTETERARRRYGLPDDYALYLGRFDPHKNVETLLAAWRLIPTSLRRRYPLVLAGPGSDRLVGKEADVVVTGFIEDEDVPALYAGARAFAFPSSYEGFGLPPLEAMAHGVPVVCSNAASLPEVTGGAAILVDPMDELQWADALERALTEEAARRQAISAGLDRVQAFRPDRTAALLVELLQTVAGTA